MSLAARADEPFYDLQEKIKTLHDSVWEHNADWPLVQKWLQQFGASEDSQSNDSLHALYLLSHFIYFGTTEIRGLLRSLYRDTFRPTVITQLRRKIGGPLDRQVLRSAFEDELKSTRFVSLGNPSESSALLLYYFRQENDLSKELFANAADLFDLRAVGSGGNVMLRDEKIRHYVFIDDLCGSGTQGKAYSEYIVDPIKRLNSDAKCYYYTLFGIVDGLDYIRSLQRFDVVSPVVEIDHTFKCFSPESRIFLGERAFFNRTDGQIAIYPFGARIWPAHPLGFKDGQLLLGFAHNTPDNTLPIFWFSGTEHVPWVPVFQRYHKRY